MESVCYYAVRNMSKFDGSSLGGPSRRSIIQPWPFQVTGRRIFAVGRPSSGENFQLQVDIFGLELEQVGIGFSGDYAP